jgi:hypothetical protein
VIVEQCWFLRRYYGSLFRDDFHRLATVIEVVDVFRGRLPRHDIHRLAAVVKVVNSVCIWHARHYVTANVSKYAIPFPAAAREIRRIVTTPFADGVTAENVNVSHVSAALVIVFVSVATPSFPLASRMACGLLVVP